MDEDVKGKLRSIMQSTGQSASEVVDNLKSGWETIASEMGMDIVEVFLIAHRNEAHYGTPRVFDGHFDNEAEAKDFAERSGGHLVQQGAVWRVLPPLEFKEA